VHGSLVGKLCFTGGTLGNVNFNDLHLWWLNIAFDK
jgi:hypothetical protein